MGKTLYVMIVAVMIFTACQQKSKTTAVDQNALKSAVSAVVDKYQAGLIAKDANVVIPLLTENGLYCGTDSKEFWDKPAFSGQLTKMFADSMKLSISNKKREMRVGPDGNSAIVVDQILVNHISPKIPVRAVYHLEKTGDNWLIDFISLGLVPDNGDLYKLSKAVE